MEKVTLIRKLRMLYSRWSLLFMCFDFSFLSCVCVSIYLLYFYSCQRNIMALYCLLIKHVAACDTQHSLDMRHEQLGGFVEWSTRSRTEVHRCCHRKRVYALPLQYVVNFSSGTPNEGNDVWHALCEVSTT